MINGIYPSGKYITVSGGNPGSLQVHNYNYGSQSSGAQSFAGEVRYNTSMSCLEIFDGTTWRQWASSMANVGLSPKAEELLDWAEKKMREEKQLEQLMKKHPGLKDAHERLEIMKTLVMEQESNES